MNDMNQGGLEAGTANTAAIKQTDSTALPETGMNGKTLRRTVVIVNPQGFHMRPQMYFAQQAQQYQSDVAVIHGETRVDGKNQWDLMLLATAQELTVEVTGPDAAQAIESLAAILAAPSMDDDPPPPKKG